MASSADAARHALWRSAAVEPGYATCVSRVLPGLDPVCAVWLPGAPAPVPGAIPAMTTQRLLVGTCREETAGAGAHEGTGAASIRGAAGGCAWLAVIEATLPALAAAPPPAPGYPTVPPHIRTVQWVCHGPNGVNRVELLPGSSDLVATTSDCGDAFLFRLAAQAQRVQLQRAPAAQGRAAAVDNSAAQDSSGREGDPGGASAAGQWQDRAQEDAPLPAAAAFRPDCVLEGRDSGGFGLAWEGPGSSRLLAAGAAPGGSAGGGQPGGIVCVWDAGRAGEGARRLAPLQSRPSGHAAGVNDVACPPFGGSGVFATCGDDGALRLHDARAPAGAGDGAGGGSVVVYSSAHGDALDCAAWEPLGGHLVAAGSSRGRLYVVDVRRAVTGAGRPNRLSAHGTPCPAVFVRQLHAAGVAQLAWCPHMAGVVATCAEDGFVAVWDVGEEAALGDGDRGSTGGGAGPGPGSAAARAPGQGRGAAAQQHVHGCGSGGGGGGEGPGAAARRHLRLTVAGTDKAPDGLLFLHGGHTSVQGLAWNPHRPWMLASVGLAPWAPGEGGAGGGPASSGGRGALEAERPADEEGCVQLWEPLVLAAHLGQR